MADQIRVHTEQMLELGRQAVRVSSAIDEIESQIRRLHLDRESGALARAQLHSAVLGCTGHGLRSGNMNECLESIAGTLNEVSRYTNALAGSIGMAADAFSDTERSLVVRFGGLMKGDSNVFRAICAVLHYDPDQKNWTLEMRNEFIQLINKGLIAVDGGIALLIHDGTNYLFDQNGLLATYEAKTGLSGIKTTTKIYPGNSMYEGKFQAGFLKGGLKHDVIEPNKIQYDKDGNKIEKTEEKKLGDKLKLLSIGVSGSQAVSAWYQQASVGNEHGEVEVSVGMLNAEAHGSVQGGFGVYLPGKDGKKTLYAGIDVEAGASVSALELKESAKYELCDMFGVSAESDVSVMKASATAGAGLGVVDGKVVAYAKAGAEANLVEVNGEVGLNVGGIEGKVGAGVQVGVGASAEAGYKDGVIKFDASVSVGVGVSINVELDVSGFVDNIGKAAESVGNAIGAVSDGISSICGWFR